MVESFCSGYYWSLDTALGMTMPQIIMLHHASHVNRKRSGMDSVSEGSSDPYDVMSEGVPEHNGKPVDQLTTEEYATYLSLGV